MIAYTQNYSLIFRLVYLLLWIHAEVSLIQMILVITKSVFKKVGSMAAVHIWTLQPLKMAKSLKFTTLVQ